MHAFAASCYTWADRVGYCPVVLFAREKDLWRTNLDGDGNVYLGLSSPDDSFETGSSLLTVSAAATEVVLWQREISWTFRHITWSPDGRYLFLDDDLDRSPIWHISADGSGDLETVIEDDFLLGVIPQWRQPTDGSGSTG